MSNAFVICNAALMARGWPEEIDGTPLRPTVSVAIRRALLVVACAQDILGAALQGHALHLQLTLSVQEFQSELLRRHARSHPELALRSESTIERARLDRPAGMEEIPRVILRQGAPRRTG